MAIQPGIGLCGQDLPATENSPVQTDGVKPAGGAEGEEFFERKVRPLLSQHCLACHGHDQQKGGLNLATREALFTGGETGAVVEAGQPEASLLIEAVEHRGGMRMPPSGKLDTSEIQTLRKWVEMGLPWPKPVENAPLRGAGEITDKDRAFWSFQPARTVAAPAVRDATWPRQKLDRFVLARLEQEGLRPSPEADRRTYQRRVAWTLTGLLPTAEEVNAFVNDPEPGAAERLVDRLLDSPHYGERWARHWLDIARYGEDQAHTFQARLYPQGYRYRDWVVSAFNRDLPYNEFVIAQIAGDLLPATSDDERMSRLPALGYFALGPVYYMDAGCAGKAVADEIDDRIDTLTRGFLGLTVSCARCHDHKFDPIPTRDYYALAGVFASSEYREAPLVPDEVVQSYDARVEAVKQTEKTLGEAQSAEVTRFAEELVPRTAEYIVTAWKLRRARQSQPKASAADLAKETGLHSLVIDRWTQFLSGNNLDSKAFLASLKPIFSTAELSADQMAVETAATLLQSELAAAVAARSQLTADYDRRVAEAASDDEKKPIARPMLASPQADLLKGLLSDRDAPFAVPKDRIESLLPEDRKAALAKIKTDVERLKKQVGPKYAFAHSLAEKQPANQKIHIRGNPKELGEEVPRGFLGILSPAGGVAFQEGSGRLELARAIASPANPLTARVLVNRVWQQHFGRGLVGTSSNFGLLGERPSHPELLDDLAARFVESGWSLKQLHREIVLSATYRMTSDPVVAEGPDPSEIDPGEIDPENKLLWRQNRRRLDIETWRDSVLAACGNLDLTVGGPSGNLNDTSHRRRTLYSAISRHDLNATLRLFDFPDPNLTSERRANTTVPMQQLFLLNSGFIVQQAKLLAKRALEEKVSGDPERIERLHRWLFQRGPTDEERELGMRFLDAALPPDVSATEVKLSAWEQYAQALLATNEFAFVD